MSSVLQFYFRGGVASLAALFITTSLYGASTTVAELLPLKIGSEKNVTRRVCTEAITAEVTLSDALKRTYNDYEAETKIIKKETDLSKVKGEDVCPAKRAVGVKIPITFSKSQADFDAKLLLAHSSSSSSSSSCSDAGVSEARALCIYPGAGGGDELIAYAVYRIETEAVSISSIAENFAANGEVSFEVRLNKTGVSVETETCYGETSLGDIDSTKDCPTTFQTQKGSSTKVSITGLKPVEYAFKVRLLRPNETPYSTSFKETPVPVAFPFDGYRGKGGELEFSCQNTSARATFLLLVISFLCLSWVRRARRQKSTIALSVMLAGAAVLFIPKDAHAELGQVNFSILGSMYRPDLDSEMVDGVKIFPFYKCFFRKSTKANDGPINPLMGGEVNVHLWDGFGSLQVGLGLGYTWVNGHGVKINDDGSYDCESPTRNVKSTLHMYQVRPQLTYAFDYFASTFPLFPYVQAALIGHGYLFRNTNSSVKATSYHGFDVKPNGFRFGYQAEVGVKLMLDFLEPSSITTAHGQGFLEHVYLKAGLSITKIDTFGRRGFQFSAKDIMGTTWPLMWTFGLEFQLP